MLVIEGTRIRVANGKILRPSRILKIKASFVDWLASFGLLYLGLQLLKSLEQVTGQHITYPVEVLLVDFQGVLVRSGSLAGGL